MLNLPFVVQPKRQPELVRIGNDELGIFEIERRGYLTVGEKSAYQQIIKNKEGLTAVRKVIGDIAAAEKISAEQAQVLVTKVLKSDKMTTKETKLAEKYASDFLDLLEVFTQEALHTQLVQASILMMSRVDQNWSFEDTARLDTTVIEQLSTLFMAEEARSREALAFNADEVAPEEVNQEPGKQEEPQEKTE